MANCTICPFDCNVDRIKKMGSCGLPNKFLISKVQQHFFEEPMISGVDGESKTGGSGTIFFTGCNGKCVFCQNYKISQKEKWMKGKFVKVSDKKLLEICLELVNKKKVFNINFVSPTPYTELLLKFLKKYKNKIKVPIVWNSNGYEKAETLKKISGLVDIYLPDFKYFDDKLAVKYSKMPNYFKFAKGSVKEMYKQVGWPKMGDNGLMGKGLIIRHLVLSGNVNDSKKVLLWIKKTFGEKAVVSLMAQYYPVYKAKDFSEINRRLTPTEYREIVSYFENLGFKNGFIQELSSADSCFTPRF